MPSHLGKAYLGTRHGSMLMWLTRCFEKSYFDLNLVSISFVELIWSNTPCWLSFWDWGVRASTAHLAENLRWRGSAEGEWERPSQQDHLPHCWPGVPRQVLLLRQKPVSQEWWDILHEILHTLRNFCSLKMFNDIIWNKSNIVKIKKNFRKCPWMEIYIF